MSLGLNEFRNRMSMELDKSLMSKSVQVSASNIKDALQEASLELSLPVSSLDYEVLERGHSGFWGFKSIPCRIIAYKSLRVITNEKVGGNTLEEEVTDIVENIENRDSDGRYSVRFTSHGEIMLKVFPPIGRGTPVQENIVFTALEQRSPSHLNTDMITSTILQADAMWIKVGDYLHEAENDAQLILEVVDNDMVAYITAVAPASGGADLSVDDIKNFLTIEGVQTGIQEEALEEFEDCPVYNTSVLVAKGREPIHGQNAIIEYTFPTTLDYSMKEKEDGSVDFKELNRFFNVVEGQVLAKKIPPTQGKDGETVYGRHLVAKDGADANIGVGKNVVLSDDESTATATVSGHVILKAGKINVEVIIVIPENVDITTGNINALGSVDIRGNVEDGFSVSAQGSIRVSGYVGKANLKAGGDIVVARGINGGNRDDYGYITAGRSIWASFIQNAVAHAGEFVIVSSGIVNANIIAYKKVLCKGIRAKIVGGHVQAAEEVNAVILGSSAGTETLIEVGIDPRLKEVYNKLSTQYRETNKKREDIYNKIQKVTHHVKLKRIKLNAEKKREFDEMRLECANYDKQLQVLHSKIDEIHRYLEHIRLEGRVSASSTVFSGVVIRIKDSEYQVKDPYEYPVSFILSEDFIKAVKYKSIAENIDPKDSL